jgi:glycosyltransferase
MGPIFGRLPSMSFEEADKTVLTEIFGRLDAQAALPGLTDVVSTWKPDVIVREPCEFSSLVAAERAGIPAVEVSIGMGSNIDSFLPSLAAPLAELSLLAGLPEDRALGAMSTAVGFTTVPAALDERERDEPLRGGDPAWRFHDVSLTARSAKLPAPWGDQESPLIYVTFGSVAASIGPFRTLYQDTLEALSDLPIRVLMTTGDTGDTGDKPLLRAVPANAHVERWWPQADVMPQAAAMVGHGGFGTTMMALAAGVPQIVVPLFAFDQSVNARRVAAIGAGIHVSGGPSSATEIASALLRLLTDPAYRTGAQAVATDMAALPDVADSVPILESLARA